MTDERAAVLIDGANLYHALRETFNKLNLDFNILVDKLVAGRKLVRTYYYTTLPDQKANPKRYAKQQRFLDALREKPYFNVTLGRLVRRGDTYIEKGVDVAIAVDMLQMAFNDAYDTAILISGDSDLARAIEVIKRQGKHVENATTQGASSRHLRQICDKVIILDQDYLSNCWRS